MKSEKEILRRIAEITKNEKEEDMSYLSENERRTYYLLLQHGRAILKEVLSGQDTEKVLKCQVYDCGRDAEYIVTIRKLQDRKKDAPEFKLCYEHYNQMGNDLNLEYIER